MRYITNSHTKLHTHTHVHEGFFSNESCMYPQLLRYKVVHLVGSSSPHSWCFFHHFDPAKLTHICGNYYRICKQQKHQKQQGQQQTSLALSFSSLVYFAPVRHSIQRGKDVLWFMCSPFPSSPLLEFSSFSLELRTNSRPHTWKNKSLEFRKSSFLCRNCLLLGKVIVKWRKIQNKVVHVLNNLFWNLKRHTLNKYVWTS